MSENKPLATQNYVTHYQLYRLDSDGNRTLVANVPGDNDGDALAQALFHAENGGLYAFCQGERNIAELEMNDNRFLYASRAPVTSPRPGSMKLFETLFIVALVIGIVHVVVGWSDVSAQVPHGIRTIFTALVAVTNVAFLALCLLISRGRSVVAKWLLIAIFGIGAIVTVDNAMTQHGLSIVPLAQFGLELAALSLLFTPASRRWIRHHP